MAVKSTMYAALVDIVESHGGAVKAASDRMVCFETIIEHLRIMVLGNPLDQNSGFLNVYETGRGHVFSARISPYVPAEIVTCKTGAWRDLVMAHQRKVAVLQ